MYIVGWKDGNDWRIEKRLLSDGTLVSGFGTSGVVTGVTESNYATTIAIDSSNNYMYVAGSDSSLNWRIEKRLLSDGTLVSGFGTSGVVTGITAASFGKSIAIDSTNMYITGDDSNSDWRIEKRLLSDGTLVSGFGTGGVITSSDASNNAESIAIDSTNVYVAGNTGSDWRIEKRLLSDGTLVSGFGTSGVVTGDAASTSVMDIAIDSTIMYAVGYNSDSNWRIEKRELSTGAFALEITDGGRTIVNQTYEEANNFTNSVATIPYGQDGLWDFSLYDYGMTAGASYCLRAIYSAGGNLDTYTVIPEIQAKGTDALTLFSYRWRNDNADEANASYPVDENEPLTSGVYIGDQRRLRVGISNTGAGSASNKTYRLEYSSGACSSWAQVPAAGDESGPWVMAASSYISDASATTDSTGLTNPAGKTFAAGIAKTTASQASAHTLSNSQFTELEYSVEPTSNVSTGTTYCFQVTHAGNANGFTYSNQPQIKAHNLVFRSRGGGSAAEAPSASPDPQVGDGSPGGAMDDDTETPAPPDDPGTGGTGGGTGGSSGGDSGFLPGRGYFMLASVNSTGFGIGGFFKYILFSIF